MLRQGSRSYGSSESMSKDTGSFAWRRIASRLDLSDKKEKASCQSVVTRARNPGGVSGDPKGTGETGLPCLGGVPIKAGSGRIGGWIQRRHLGWEQGFQSQAELVNFVGSLLGDARESTSHYLVREGTFFQADPIATSSVSFSAMALQSRSRSLSGGVIVVLSSLDAPWRILFRSAILDTFVDCAFLQRMLCGKLDLI
jgi:hypothetical protein